MLHKVQDSLNETWKKENLRKAIIFHQYNSKRQTSVNHQLETILSRMAYLIAHSSYSPDMTLQITICFRNYSFILNSQSSNQQKNLFLRSMHFLIHNYYNSGRKDFTSCKTLAADHITKRILILLYILILSLHKLYALK